MTLDIKTASLPLIDIPESTNNIHLVYLHLVVLPMSIVFETRVRKATLSERHVTRGKTEAHLIEVVAGQLGWGGEACRENKM